MRGGSGKSPKAVCDAGEKGQAEPRLDHTCPTRTFSLIQKEFPAFALRRSFSPPQSLPNFFGSHSVRSLGKSWYELNISLKQKEATVRHTRITRLCFFVHFLLRSLILGNARTYAFLSSFTPSFLLPLLGSYASSYCLIAGRCHFHPILPHSEAAPASSPSCIETPFIILSTTTKVLPSNPHNSPSYLSHPQNHLPNPQTNPQARPNISVSGSPPPTCLTP